MQFGQRSVGQGSKVAAGPSTCGDWKLRRISERLASWVKGLTADFWVLLVINLAPPRALAVFSQSVAAAAKRLWWRQACAFRTTARLTRNNPTTRLATAGRDAKVRKSFDPAVFPGSILLYPTAKDLIQQGADRPARPTRRVQPWPRLIGLENTMTSTPVSTTVLQMLKPAGRYPTSALDFSTRFRHSISPIDRCPICRCRAPHDVRAATAVSPVQIRILRARPLTTRSP
jgi:hypothetical protein